MQLSYLQFAVSISPGANHESSLTAVKLFHTIGSVTYDALPEAALIEAVTELTGLQPHRPVKLKKVRQLEFITRIV
jgi:hypothetical protein